MRYVKCITPCRISGYDLRAGDVKELPEWAIADLLASEPGCIEVLGAEKLRNIDEQGPGTLKAEGAGNAWRFERNA